MNSINDIPRDEQLEALLDQALAADDARLAPVDGLADRIVAATAEPIARRRAVIARLSPLRLGAVAAAVIALSLGAAMWVADVARPRPAEPLAADDVERVFTELDLALDAAGAEPIDQELHLLSVAIGEIEARDTMISLTDPMTDDLWLSDGDLF